MQEEIIYGINAVSEALRGTRRAFELFVSGDGRKIDEIVRRAQERNVSVRRRERRDLDRLAGTDHHQGVVLRVEAFAYADVEDIVGRHLQRGGDGFILILDGIQDPHNLGALIRSAACAGADGVIIPRDRAASVTAVAEKSSAGAVSMMPVAQVSNVAQFLDSLKENNFWIYGAAGEGATSIFSTDLSGNVAIVIGNEGEGIRPLVRKKCDFIVSIPMAGGPGSLNASVAGGIIMFEVLKRRLLAGK